MAFDNHRVQNGIFKSRVHDFEPKTAQSFHLVNGYQPGDTLPPPDRAGLQRLLRRYDVTSVQLCVYGFVGSGKSSLINSICYTMSGNYLEYCPEGKLPSENGESVTNRRSALRLTEFVQLVDNKGFSEVTSDVLNEVGKQCDGLRSTGESVPDSWQQSPAAALKDAAKGICVQRDFSRMVHCPIIVYSLRQDQDVYSLRTIIDRIKTTTGSSPIVVLTNEDAVADVNLVQHRTSQFQTLNCARVFSLSNYTYRDHVNRRTTDDTIIDMLFHCCLVADQSLSYNLLRKRGGLFCC